MAGLQIVAQGLPFEVIHLDVGVPAGDIGVVDGHGIGVTAEPGEDLGLLHEAEAIGLVLGDFRLDDLQARFWSSPTCSTSQTKAMPPPPSLRMTRYLPKRWPRESAGMASWSS